jgi:ATP-dependent exoDNAse (exonuclease V) beta subunit
LIVKDVARHVVADGRTTYDTWKLARINARERGSVPSVAVQTVRERIADVGRPVHPSTVARDGLSEVEGQGRLDGEAESLALHVSVVSVPQWLRDRPSGAAFGSLVHAVLARAPFDADRSSLETIASVEARLLALDDADGAAAAAVVERVLAHDLLVRARHADARGGCRRETPITLTLEDGTLVEGSVDLAFEEDGRWVVVDYKTDREIAEKGDVQYRRQLSLYAAAIERATGQPVEGVLVRI